MSREREKKGQIQQASKRNIHTPVASTIFKRDRNSDRSVFNIPTVDKVAMIFRSIHG